MPNFEVEKKSVSAVGHTWYASYLQHDGLGAECLMAHALLMQVRDRQDKLQADDEAP